MNFRLAGTAALAAVFVAGCAARSSNLPGLDMRFYETPSQGEARQRHHEEGRLNATVIGDASLRYLKPAELLKAAETDAGRGDPQKLMRAARTLTPGDGVVLLGTVRSTSASGRSADMAIYSLALSCAKTDLDKPGDLRDCKGYVLRVTRQWPAEVYAIQEATVSLISEGGTAIGRIRAKSEPGAFKAELEGEFAASLLELGSGTALSSEAPR